jgi:hypothetical protein
VSTRRIRRLLLMRHPPDHGLHHPTLRPRRRQDSHEVPVETAHLRPVGMSGGSFVNARPQRRAVPPWRSGNPELSDSVAAVLGEPQVPVGAGRDLVRREGTIPVTPVYE